MPCTFVNYLVYTISDYIHTWYILTILFWQRTCVSWMGKQKYTPLLFQNKHNLSPTTNCWRTFSMFSLNARLCSVLKSTQARTAPFTSSWRCDSPFKSTGNKATPYVTPRTIGYIHGLIVSITLFHSDACNTRNLRNETMILEVLEEHEPAVFRQGLFTTL